MRFLNKRTVSIMMSFCSIFYFNDKKPYAKINFNLTGTRTQTIVLITLGVLGLGIPGSLMIYKLSKKTNDISNSYFFSGIEKIDGVKEIIYEWSDSILKTCDKNQASQIIIDENSIFFDKFKLLLKNSKYDIDNMGKNFVPVFKIETDIQVLKQNEIKKINYSKNTQTLFLYFACADNIEKYLNNKYLLFNKIRSSNDYESD